MSELVSALDLHNILDLKKTGENLHCEYKWSNNYNSNYNKLVQLFFQLVITKSEEKLNEIADIFIETFILSQSRDYKLLLLKMLLNTRDIIKGKGEKALSYAILHKLSIIEPEIAKELIRSFVYIENEHPIGSWADIKYMWSLYDWIPDMENFFISLINNQLKQDENESSNKSISLVSKWIPRETNKHKNLFKKLAQEYYLHYISSVKSTDKLAKAYNKAYMDYSKLVTKLSRKLDVTQIKQCEKKYSEINYNKVTSITMNKQKSAFSNKKKKEEEDRILGAKNFEKFINDSLQNKKEIKGKRVSIYDFIKDALYFNKNKENNNENLIKILNSQWKDSEKLIDGQLGNFIAMVDTSGSMETDNCTPLYNAIGLGIRVAEKSLLGKRVMSFNSNASWINLENDDDLVSMVSKIKKAPWGMNTNFMQALDMILECIIEKKLTPHDVENLTLCIFSDMQIDYADKNSLNNSFWECINKKYHDTGITHFGVPFNPPNILFWNMRITEGFPVMSEQKNVSMLSGFSPVLLNTFCNKGYSELKNMNSYNMLTSILNIDRYSFVDKLIEECTPTSPLSKRGKV